MPPFNPFILFFRFFTCLFSCFFSFRCFFSLFSFCCFFSFCLALFLVSFLFLLLVLFLVLFLVLLFLLLFLPSIHVDSFFLYFLIPDWIDALTSISSEGLELHRDK
eukprot:Phypoly_transcript_19644.p2 GENE.Phypoly_transcript_19644~~Phypoly_transcript_19644.p2  ORF type:complete len:106 (-),score=7.12 Phypoly_transcript_19644:323-640(-)